MTTKLFSAQKEVINYEETLEKPLQTSYTAVVWVTINPVMAGAIVVRVTSK